MNQNEQNNALPQRGTFVGKGRFHSHTREEMEKMMEEQRDAIKQTDHRYFRNMIQFIPEVRRRVPKSDQEVIIQCYDKYMSNMQKSTLFTIPVTFFAFCNRYTQNLIGRSGTFILSIMSTTMLTFGNIMLFQQIYNRDRIEKLNTICTQYKPIIRNQQYQEFLDFLKCDQLSQKLLEDDKVADKTYELVLKQIELKKQNKFTLEAKSNYFSEIRKLRLQSDEKFREQVLRAEEQFKAYEQKQEEIKQRELLKQQQILEQKQ